jgi:Fe-S cluster assembly protein SufD
MTIQMSSTLEPKVVSDRTSYLTQLVSDRPSLPSSLIPAIKSGLETLRNQAADQALELEIPSTREEEWRFTDLTDLLKTQFSPATFPTLDRTEIEPYRLLETDGARLVFVNGVYAPALSDTQALPSELWVGSLTQATDAALLEQLRPYLAQQPGAEEVFTTLNTASLTDAAVIWIPQQQAIAPPIHLLFIATAGTVNYPRCLVVAQSSSSVTLLEDYVTVGDTACFTNAVTELWLEANAQVNHIRLQRDNIASFHIAKTAVSQAREARYSANAISFGAHLSRHHFEVYQTGSQTETTLNGLTMIKGEQVADTHSAIAFTQPHGTSRQLHKCIVDDRAHAIFNGKVFVPKAAQLTDAGQLNRNLLLSPKARVDTKPQLEIVADNVKCTHGAAVGQLDTESVFYLQSRGIDTDSARKLLVYAFAYEIIDQIAIASLQKKLIEAVSY